MNNIMSFDALALNQKIIEVEDILFELNHNNIVEVTTKVAATLEIMVEILSKREDFSSIIFSLVDLAKIHQVISTKTSLMNNLVINTTFQVLNLSYCIIINEENKYLIALQQTYSVIKNILATVKGEQPDHVAPAMAKIINHIQRKNSADIVFFDGDNTNDPKYPEKKLKILIVDDELIHQTLMRKMVDSYGSCDIADNGKIALRMFNDAHNCQIPYDMITLDIMMPIMDGQQTLKMIRRRERELGITPDREVIIFMVSSMDGDHVLDAFFSGHCTDYIKKPYSQETILGKMRSSHLIN
ncbi:hypothetical protein CCP3SC5AM1_30036 [Gammaproteobacteria bacterium]